VNDAKARIDEASHGVQARRSRAGGAAVDEEEYAWADQLVHAKREYREAAAALQNARATLQAAGQALQLAKAAQLRAFEAWYRKGTGRPLPLLPTSPTGATGAGFLATSSSSILGSTFAPTPRGPTDDDFADADADAFAQQGIVLGGGTRDAHGDQLDDGEAFEQIQEQRVLAREPDALSFFHASKKLAEQTRKSPTRLRGTGVGLTAGRGRHIV
jgi:hypothetical protein